MRGKQQRSTKEQVGAKEIGALDANTLERPDFRRRNQLGPLLTDDEGVGTKCSADAGVPGDCPVRLEEFFGSRQQVQFDGAPANDVALWAEPPFMLEAGQSIGVLPRRKNLARQSIRPGAGD